MPTTSQNGRSTMILSRFQLPVIAGQQQLFETAPVVANPAYVANLFAQRSQASR